MKKRGLKRRRIRSKPGSKPPEYVVPQKKEKGSTYSQTKDYRYFMGHIVPEVAKELPERRVICWRNDHMLSLYVCALNKFWHLRGYCKRCPLFQDDEHAQALKVLIEQWEIDDLE